MSLSQVYELFLNSLDPSADVRKRSEEQLNTISTSNGFLPHLIELICMPQCQPHLKQAIVIYFKNKVNKFWRAVEDQHCLNDEDKSFIKANILNIVSTCDIPFIRIQLLSSLNLIIRFEYPSSWPELLNEILPMLQDSRMPSMLTGLEAFQRLISNDNFESDVHKEAIFEQVFPIVLRIANCAFCNPAELSRNVMKITLKIFFNAIEFVLPAYFQREEVLSEWIQLMINVLNQPCPAIPPNDHSSEIEKKMCWKTKKWACHCINQLFCRYGSSKDEYISSKLSPAFRKMFMAKFAVPLTKLYLSLITSQCSGKETFITDRMLCIICDFLSSAIKPKTTWNEMQGHLELLIAKLIFPRCCFSAEDDALWNEDPAEFIREKMNPFSEIYDPVSACSNLLIDLAMTRNKIVFTSILSFINTILNKYLSAEGSHRNPQEKDGALYMIGCLSNLIANSPVNESMESFLVMHVLPELQSNFAFLRARACWIFQRFDSIHFSEQQNALYAWEGISRCMMDKDLPVRVQAALAVGTLLEYEIVREAMRPHIVSIMQLLMNLTNESDSDALSCVMDQLVEIFPTEIAPFSTNIITQLVNTIMLSLENYSAYTVAEDEEDLEGCDSDETDKIMVVIGLFRTIIGIVEAVKANPVLLSQIDQTMNPLIVLILQKQIIDLYEDAFDYLETITFNLKTILPHMWAIYELVYASFKTNAMDYLGEMSTFLDNVISYGTDVFLSNEKYPALLFEIIQFTLTSDLLGENDTVYSCKLIESMLLNCKGKVDNYCIKFVEFGLRLLKSDPKSLSGKIHYTQLLINCVFYNAQLTVRHLDSLDGTFFFFQYWFENIKLFKRVHDKKLCVLAINEILKVPFRALSSVLQNGYPKLMFVVGEMLSTLPDAYKKRKEAAEELQNGFDGEQDYVYDGVDDDEEDLEYDDKEEFGTDGPEFIGFDDDDDSDDDFFDELEEEVYFQTPLDNIDPFQSLSETISCIQNTDKQSFDILMKDLGNEEKQKLMQSFSLTEKQFTLPSISK